MRQTVDNKHKFIISHAKRLVMNEMSIQRVVTRKQEGRKNNSSSSRIVLMTRYM